MSEYGHQPRSRQEAPQEATLFDDNVIDSMADKLGSYDAAYRALGITPPAYEPLAIAAEAEASEPTPGASVELGARALALANIMGTYNQLNKAMGANKVRQYGGNPFDNRYGKLADEVSEGMGAKAAAMIAHNKADFEVLNASADMHTAGFTNELVSFVDRGTKKTLLNDYGPGKVYALDRRQVVSRAEKTAKRVNKKK